MYAKQFNHPSLVTFIQGCSDQWLSLSLSFPPHFTPTGEQLHTTLLLHCVPEDVTPTVYYLTGQPSNTHAVQVLSVVSDNKLEFPRVPSR